MNNKNYVSKNSQYVQSLVDFILDTKPYHSKLTEISEEYQFYDTMNLKFTESIFSKIKLASPWTYTFFSSGDSNDNIFQTKRIASPMFAKYLKNSEPAKSRGQFKAYRDETIDLGITPIKIGKHSSSTMPNSALIRPDQVFFAYDKRSFDDIGVNDALVERKGLLSKSEPLLEGHDFFQSHGAFKFQITQTKNASGVFIPLFVSNNNSNLIYSATQTTRTAALDVTNPNSSVNKARAILEQIRVDIGEFAPIDVVNQLNALFAILSVPNLPSSYTKLFDSLLQFGLYTQAQADVKLNQLRGISSPLFFGKYTDLGYRESGELAYAETDTEFLRIYNFVVNTDVADYEEWTLTAVAEGTELYRVEGSKTGKLGFIRAGDSYANTKVSFDTQSKGVPYYGYTASLKPVNKMVIHPGAKLESWTLVKVNPLAYSRPFFASKRYGNITNLNGTLGQISVLDQTFPNQRFYFKCNDDGLTFDMTSVDDENYYNLVNVDTMFNNGVLAFTINNGTEEKFRAGDKFYVDIQNKPAYIEDIDLGYGYDLDSYDDQDLLYKDGTTINFAYATRFPLFNTDFLHVTVNEKAIDGRKWRARALPGPTYINEVHAFEQPNGITPSNLKFYLADRFAVEWSDDNFQTFTFVKEILPQQQFISEELGVSFVIPYLDKPFIAARSDEGDSTCVEGGDIMSFTVRNPPPSMDNIGLSSSRVPRLIMHGDSFHETVPAKWKVSTESNTRYLVEGNKHHEWSLDQGQSFKKFGIHFTLVTGSKGVKPGEFFTFETYDDKPSYLVHGSVTGWTGEATVGEYYSNGLISFKLDLPKAGLFVDSSAVINSTVGSNEGVKELPNKLWQFGAGEVQVMRLRSDSTATVYYFKRSNNGYLITSANEGVVGFVKFDSTFEGKLISIRITDPQVDNFRIQITPHIFELWTGQDAVIVRPKELQRYPSNTDFVVIEKTQSDTLGISLTSGAANISELLPETIDKRFIDSLDKLTNISKIIPNIDVINGWIPCTNIETDIDASLANFSDSVVKRTFVSAASGETIGVLKPSGINLDENVLFEWDTDFFNKYLPLNAEANIVAFSTAWDDKVSLNFSETFRYLGGSGLLEDQTMTESISINIIDSPVFKVTIGNEANGSSPISDRIFVRMIDSGFNGFVPGYDNMPFDAELLSQMVSTIDVQTSNDIRDLLSAMELSLKDPNLSDEEKHAIKMAAYDERDSIVQERMEIKASLIQLEDTGSYDASEPAPTYNQFGIPMKGLGIDIEEKPTAKAKTAIVELITFNSANSGNSLDSRNFDIGRVDEQPDQKFIVNISGNSSDDFEGKTFEEFNTQLSTDSSRVFEIYSTNGKIPQIKVWLPDDEEPFTVPNLYFVSENTYGFSLPSFSPAKLIVTFAI